MRKLSKLEEPEILSTNKNNWLRDYKNNKSDTHRYRYRHPEIKGTLKEETGFKCIYCESKIGHNTPGDVEHIIPTSKDENQHFTWYNLSIACTECNRRKNDYYNEGDEFLNPYVDDNVEDLIEHYGPIVNWKNGNARAEITVKTLELNKTSRYELIFRKIEKIEETNTLVERYIAETNPSLKKIQELQLNDMINFKSEYSGMVKTLLIQKGIFNN